MRTFELCFIACVAVVLTGACSQAPTDGLGGGDPTPPDAPDPADAGLLDSARPDDASPSPGDEPALLPEARSYQLALEVVQRTAPVADLPPEYRQASPFVGAEFRVDLPEVFSGLVSWLHVMPEDVDLPAQFFPVGPDAETIAGPVLYRNLACAICGPAEVRLDDGPASLLVETLTADHVEVIDDVHRWAATGTFTGAEAYRRQDGEWVSVAVEGRVRIRPDDVSPIGRFGSTVRPVLLPWEAVGVRFSEPVLDRDADVHVKLDDREVPLDIEVEPFSFVADGLISGFRIRPVGIWPAGFLRFEYGGDHADFMGNVASELGFRTERIRDPAPAPRLDFETPDDDVATWGGRRSSPPAAWCEGQGCVALELAELSGVYARLRLDAPTARVRMRVRALSETCDGANVTLTGWAHPDGEAPLYRRLIGPSLELQSVPFPPPIGCDSGWVDVSMPLDTRGAETFDAVGVAVEARAFAETMTGGILVVDDIGPE